MHPRGLLGSSTRRIEASRTGYAKTHPERLSPTVRQGDFQSHARRFRQQDPTREQNPLSLGVARTHG